MFEVSLYLRCGARTVSRFPARESRWRLDNPWKHSAATVWIRQSARLRNLYFQKQSAFCPFRVHLRATSWERGLNALGWSWIMGFRSSSSERRLFTWLNAPVGTWSHSLSIVCRFLSSCFFDSWLYDRLRFAKLGRLACLVASYLVSLSLFSSFSFLVGQFGLFGCLFVCMFVFFIVSCWCVWLFFGCLFVPRLSGCMRGRARPSWSGLPRRPGGQRWCHSGGGSWF